MTRTPSSMPTDKKKISKSPIAKPTGSSPRSTTTKKVDGQKLAIHVATLQTKIDALIVDAEKLSKRTRLQKKKLAKRASEMKATLADRNKLISESLTRNGSGTIVTD